MENAPVKQRSKKAKELGSPLHHIKKVQCKLHMNLYFHLAPISVSERHTHAMRLDTSR